jgi:hypothetical protein
MSEEVTLAGDVNDSFVPEINSELLTSVLALCFRDACNNNKEIHNNATRQICMVYAG